MTTDYGLTIISYEFMNGSQKTRLVRGFKPGYGSDRMVRGMDRLLSGHVSRERWYSVTDTQIPEFGSVC